MKRDVLKRIILYMLCMISAIVFSACGMQNENKKGVSCVISVSCEEILRHMDELKEEKKSLVPENGMILEEITVEAEEKSALELLEKELRENKIHFDKAGAYIKGIGNLYEKDCGAYSGWIYTVNGEYVEKSADAYYPKDGDVIEWSYMTGLE